MPYPREAPAKNRSDLSGQRFGSLFVTAYSETRGRRAFWSCDCDCGGKIIVSGKDLRSGHTRSCGCKARGWKHGLHRHRFYYTYQGMMKRCFNPKHIAYPRYGGRGISVCREWVRSMEAFFCWCETQEPIPKGFTLDRENNNGSYSPENCRFVSKSTQQRNSRRYQR
jgi:hypothetical protein